MTDGRRHDAQLDARTSLAKVLEHRRQPVIRGVTLRTEAQQLAAAECPAGDVDARALDLAQHRARGAQQALARLRRNEPTGLSLEQRDADAPLQPPQAVTQGRLRDIEPNGGTRDRPLIGNRDEHTELAGLEIHVGE
jgi:hypothetical protein